MTIWVNMIQDSISDAGIRLTTMQLRYPRYIHAEFMTHRVFSRNASSSRAIPVKRLIEDILDDPVIPMHWGKNQKGMQADEECSNDVTLTFMAGQDVYVERQANPMPREQAWRAIMLETINHAQSFMEAGYHKQIVNRLLEPFSHINVVVTSTEWSNFYALRRDRHAMPEIRVLADRMYEAQERSKPEQCPHGDWHLPYINQEDIDNAVSYLRSKSSFPPTIKNLGPKLTQDVLDTTIRMSVARCARVSYLTTEGDKPSVEADLLLYDRLLSAQPIHASPAEHQATPDGLIMPDTKVWQNPHLHGNLNGWRQYRKMLPGESQ